MSTSFYKTLRKLSWKWRKVRLNKKTFLSLCPKLPLSRGGPSGKSATAKIATYFCRGWQYISLPKLHYISTGDDNIFLCQNCNIFLQGMTIYLCRGWQYISAGVDNVCISVFSFGNIYQRGWQNMAMFCNKQFLFCKDCIYFYRRIANHILRKVLQIYLHKWIIESYCGRQQLYASLLEMQLFFGRMQVYLLYVSS